METLEANFQEVCATLFDLMDKKRTKLHRKISIALGQVLLLPEACLYTPAKNETKKEKKW
jgi:hypothetical protein